MANRRKIVVALIVLCANLVLEGCGPAYPSDLRTAVQKGDLNRVETILAQRPELVNPRSISSSTPLLDAIQHHHNDLAQFLIAKGANVKAKGSGRWTALHYAGRFFDAKEENNKEVVELLIANGVRVDAKDAWGDTPLHYAALYGHKDMVELLVTNGANVNSINKQGHTPLNNALGTNADQGNRNVAKILILNGADVNVTPKHGQWSNLHQAAGKGWDDVAQLLIEKGADVNVRDRFGVTPLQVALSEGHKEIVELLRKNGAVE